MKSLSLEEYQAKSDKAHAGKYKILSKTGPHVQVLCSSHGEFQQLAYNHFRGVGCKHCYWGKTKGLLMPIAEAQRKSNTVHQDRYKILALTREDRGTYGYTIAEIVCPIHGQFKQPLNSHLSGRGCRACGDAAVAEAQRTPLADITSALHSKGYSYLSHRIANYKTLVSYMCSKHGKVTQAFQHIVAGRGCQLCGTQKVSKPNLEIQSYIQSLGVEVELEFKIGRPSFDIKAGNLLIEYNGNYWHSSEYRESGDHKRKQLLGESEGYRVIQLFSDEWANRQPQVKALLAHALGKSEKSIPARKCKLEAIDHSTATAFLNTYHIQGGPRSGSHVGVFYEGTLAGVASYSEALSANRTRSDSVELTRYATSRPIAGGLGKVSKHILKLTQAPALVSFSDRRMFTGQAYQKAGYSKAYELQPDYWYLEGEERKHKSGYQKSRLAQRFGTAFCGDLTERQITEKAGIFRVYDAGKIKWVMTSQP